MELDDLKSFAIISGSGHRAKQISLRKTLIRRHENPTVAKRRTPFQNLEKSSKVYPVHFAVMSGNASEVERLLQSEFARKTISSIDNEDMTPLHYAARNDDCEVASTLLGHGAILDCITKRGTPLQLAMRYRKSDVAFLLLRNGADVGLQDHDGMNALHLAADNFLSDIVSKLVASSMLDVNSEDSLMNTALHYAAVNGDVTICKTLLEYGATPHLCNRSEETALHLAASENNIDIVKTLIDVDFSSFKVNKDSFMNMKRSDRKTALHLAFRMGHLEIAKLLIEHGADLQAEANGGKTALHFAARSRNEEVVKFLMERDFPPNVQDGKKRTPLHYAIYHGDSQIANLLLANGASVDTRDSNGTSPFLLAVEKDNHSLVVSLLDDGAQASSQDYKLKTALHYAIENENFPLVKLLLDKCKALVGKKDEENRSSLHYAAQSGNTAILKYIVERTMQVNKTSNFGETPLHIVARLGHVELVEVLANDGNGESANFRNREERTPLHLAVIFNQPSVCLALLEHKAVVDPTDENDWTPLQYAAFYGHMEVLQILLQFDAKLNHADNWGSTPLMIAAEADKADAVALLLDAGANVVAQNQDGDNFFDLALDFHRESVVMKILESCRWREALSSKGASGSHFMTKLIEKYPAAAETVLDRSTSFSDHHPEHPDFTVTFDYYFLEEVPRSVSIGADIAKILAKDHGMPYFAPKLMLKCGRERLMQHPIITNLISLKWDRLCRYFYYFRFFVYLVFNIFLNIIIVLERRTQTNIEKELAKSNYSATSLTKLKSELPSANNYGKVMGYVVLSFALLQILNETFKMLIFRHKYFYRLENYVELTLYISTIVFVRTFLFKVSTAEEPVVTVLLCIFLAWTNHLLYMQVLPFYNLYVVIFVHVCMTVVKLLVVFAVILLAFILIFYLLFINETGFKSTVEIIVKILVMMTGELDFSNWLAGKSSEKVNNYPKLPYPALTYTVFVLFLLIVTVAFTNLLIGLAVGDIGEIRSSAKLHIFQQQLQLIESIQAVVPKYFLKKYIQKRKVVYEINKKSRLQRLIAGLTSDTKDQELKRLRMTKVDFESHAMTAGNNDESINS